jgi:anti-sigma factor RsiW
MVSVECRNARRGMGSYRDGESSPAERLALEAHFAACPDCAARLADAQALGGLLRLHAEEMGKALPADFSARVMAALPVERPALAAGWQPFWRSKIRLLLGALAVATATAAVLIPLLVGGRTDRSSGAENEAHIHRLAVQSPGAQPLVFQNDLGETVIWVVPEAASGAETGGSLPESSIR